MGQPRILSVKEAMKRKPTKKTRMINPAVIGTPGKARKGLVNPAAIKFRLAK